MVPGIVPTCPRLTLNLGLKRAFVSLELPEGEGCILPGFVPKVNASSFFEDGSISREATSQARKWGGKKKKKKRLSLQMSF